jgi:hypothetical protein
MTKEFTTQIERLISHELPAARLQPDRMAAMIDILTAGLALAIAVAAGGDGSKAELLMQGAENQLAVEVAALAPIARALP